MYGGVGRRVVESGVVEVLTICKMCKRFDECQQENRWDDFCLNYDKRPPTIGDNFRSQSDEQLAEELFLISCGLGPEGVKTAEEWLEWVKKEAES